MTKAKDQVQEDLGLINWVGSYWRQRPRSEVGVVRYGAPKYLKIIKQSRLIATYLGSDGKTARCRHWRIVRHYENISRLEGMVGVGE